MYYPTAVASKSMSPIQGSTFLTSECLFQELEKELKKLTEKLAKAKWAREGLEQQLKAEAAATETMNRAFAQRRDREKRIAVSFSELERYAYDSLLKTLLFVKRHTSPWSLNPSWSYGSIAKACLCTNCDWIFMDIT
eukprot:1175332-Prorocentrum_minimum.AAC.2